MEEIRREEIGKDLPEHQSWKAIRKSRYSQSIQRSFWTRMKNSHIKPLQATPAKAAAPDLERSTENMKKQNPTCQVCGQGELKKKKKYRMSGPVVVIGYIFLIPSVLGMLFGILMMFATGSAATETSSGIEEALREELLAAEIPTEITEKIIQYETLTDEDLSSLSEEQSRAVSSAKLSYSAGKVGAGAGTAIAGGFSLFVIVSSFVGGLIGWLLVMKKKVLQCISCNAIVAAS